MSHGKILQRAWEITWRWRVLWILGFLASLGKGGGGGGGGGSGSSFSGDGGEWAKSFESIPGEIWVLIAFGALLAILVGIAIWVVSVMARGGLIAGVQQVEAEGTTSFLQAWRVGRSRFWTLFGLDVLASVPFVILLLLGIAALAVVVIGGGVAFDEIGAIAPAILCGVPLCCGAVIVAVVLNQIKIYADRAAILEDLGWIDAFKRGWEVLRDNIGPTVIFWLIFLVIGGVFAFVVGGTVFAAVAPFAAVFATTDPGPWIAAPLCFGGLLGVIFFALIGSIVETFTSATWTLAYRDLTGLAAPADSEE